MHAFMMVILKKCTAQELVLLGKKNVLFSKKWKTHVINIDYGIRSVMLNSK